MKNNAYLFSRKLLVIYFFSSFFFISGGLLFIDYLTNKVEELSKKEKILITQSKLHTLEIEDKVQDIEELSSKIDYIEERIGLTHSFVANEVIRLDFAKITLKERNNILRVIPSGAPVKNTVVTSKFGYRVHPITGKKNYHRGLDYRAKRGTPVYATADGIIKFVRSTNKTSFGRVIMISHNYGFESVFAHLKKTKVKIGDVVYKGDLIGYTGNSGRSSGPHLHYEIKYGTSSLNPIYFVKWDLKSYEKLFEKVRRVPWKSLLNQIKLHELAIKE